MKVSWKKQKRMYALLFLVGFSMAALFPAFPCVRGKASSTWRCQNYTSLVPVWRQIHPFAFMGLSFILFWCAAFLFSTLLLLSFHPCLLWTHSGWLGLNVFAPLKPLRPVFWLFFLPPPEMSLHLLFFKDKIGWSDSHSSCVVSQTSFFSLMLPCVSSCFEKMTSNLLRRWCCKDLNA